MRESVRHLIQRYQQAALQAASVLREQCGVADLFAAYRSGLIPDRGGLGEATGWTYKFHGGGCYFKLGDTKVDVDFGPDSRVDGFDAGRLLRFAQETLGDQTFDYPSLRSELRLMCEQGELLYPELPPNSHLFFIAPAPHGPQDDVPPASA